MTKFDRERWFREKYGLSIAKVEAIFLSQKGLCPICGCLMTLEGRWAANRAVLDHCHKTRKIRSLICNQCNRGLGCFQDNADILINAVVYVKTHALNENPIGFVTRNLDFRRKRR